MKLPAFLRTFSTLQLALGVSIAVHAALISVRFIDPEGFNRVFQDTPLEVILVNAKSNERPDKAQAIAQANLAGGGDAEKGRATSPLPYSALTAIGDDYEEAQRKMDAMQAQQAQLLTRLRKQLATMPEPDLRQPSQNSEQATEQEKRRQLVKLLAEIEKRINEENSRPKKRYVSPATREASYAIYQDAVRHMIEDKGTENFPEQAGRKLYGELIMIITINHDGRVFDTEVVQGSGNATLDRRAEAIARAAGPFGRFTPEIRQQMDQMAMVTRFKFTRDQPLEIVVKENAR